VKLTIWDGWRKTLLERNIPGINRHAVIGWEDEMIELEEKISRLAEVGRGFKTKYAVDGDSVDLLLGRLIRLTASERLLMICLTYTKRMRTVA